MKLLFNMIMSSWVRSQGAPVSLVFIQMNRDILLHIEFDLSLLFITIENQFWSEENPYKLQSHLHVHSNTLCINNTALKAIKCVQLMQNTAANVVACSICYDIKAIKSLSTVKTQKNNDGIWKYSCTLQNPLKCGNYIN